MPDATKEPIDLSAEITRLKSCIDAQSATCARQEARIAELERAYEQANERSRRIALKFGVSQEKESRYRNAVARFLNAKGSDLCHENRAALAKDCELNPLSPAPMNVQEFDDGCQAYQRETFGACGRDKIEAERDQFRADITRQNEAIRTMGERCEVLTTMLRRWFDSESQIGQYDTVVGPSALLAETERVLAQTKETRG
jgi:hypothetical protein